MSDGPVDLTVRLPDGADPTAGGVRQHLEDELRTRGEVLDDQGSTLLVRAYARDEVESVADELVDKLVDLGMDGVTVSWTDDEGTERVRPAD